MWILQLGKGTATAGYGTGYKNPNNRAERLSSGAYGDMRRREDVLREESQNEREGAPFHKRVTPLGQAEPPGKAESLHGEE